MQIKAIVQNLEFLKDVFLGGGMGEQGEHFIPDLGDNTRLSFSWFIIVYKFSTSNVPPIAYTLEFSNCSIFSVPL